MYRIINPKRELFRINQILFNCVNEQHASRLENTHELAPGYVPRDVERGECSEYFHPTKIAPTPYSLILPPPNITGILHLGHALAVTVQDVLVRWHRMRGFETLWIPGVDHAGIATQVVVEKNLWKEKRKTRHDLGRERFEAEVWKWKEEKAEIIRQQLRRMGASLDWPREMFTMDSTQSRSVTAAFVKLYDLGLIYRSDYLVNWSCVLRSAISDIEVEHLEVPGRTAVPVPGYDQPVQFGLLTKFAYKLCDSDEEIIVATTRPETVLGDVAVAVHPKDERYASLIGRRLRHPFRNENIPVICDDFVDTNFGTGAVKVTPAHDHVDFEVGKRHGLDVLSVIDERGDLNANCGELAGMRRFDARRVVLDELHRLNLLRGQQDHGMIVPICSRSKDVVEFLVRPQWFLKCHDMALKALDDVRNGNLEIDPPIFERDWSHWLENIRDWCISRQLWWGHRIPAYFCHVKDDPERTCCVAAENPEDARSDAALRLSCHLNDVIVRQDDDVLDTWFSSALLPFSALGWPQQTEDLKKYYPLSIMETGHDILFFWVARMVMLGTQLTGRLPFSKILLHGIVCDSQGRKMSKSLGNVIAPEDIISGRSLKELESASKNSYDMGVLTEDELKNSVQGQKKMFPDGIPECGSDALRFTLCSHNIKSHFMTFDVQECKTNKFFGNKIWQATKFSNKWFDAVPGAQEATNVEYESLAKMDRWILSRLSCMVQIVNESLGKHEFHNATAGLKDFLYYDFCDVYLETTKRGLRSGSAIAVGHCWTLGVCLDVGLRCLAPFMPRLAQHLHERLALHPSWSRRVDYPQNMCWRNVGLEEDVDRVLDVVVAIRRMKKTFNVTGKDKPQALLITKLPLYSELSATMQDLSACDSLAVEPTSPPVAGAVTDTAGDVTIHLLVPEDLRRAFEVDLPKVAAKKVKLVAELDKMKRITSTDAYRSNASERSRESNAKKMAILEEKIERITYMQELSRRQET